MEKPLHVVTPLRRSTALSKLVPGCPGVYLKMENYQVPGSFKIRGYGRLAQKFKKEGYKHMVVATTGNTGLAVAHAAQLLNMQCTLYIPLTAPEECVDTMRQTGLEVKVVGAQYQHCLEHAVEASKEQDSVLASGMDPEIWAGHSSLVDELVTQLPCKPGLIAASISDGGMLIGILKGLKRVGWQDVPVLAMETVGADCFNLTMKAKKVVVVEEITSVANSLAAETVMPHLLEILPEYNVFSEVVTDAQAVESCIRFLDDEYVMVEPACGATLGAVYSGLLAKMFAEGKLPQLASGPAVLVVCGGRCVSLKLLTEWAERFKVPFPYPKDNKK